jgi:hypothetical protein
LGGTPALCAAAHACLDRVADAARLAARYLSAYPAFDLAVPPARIPFTLSEDLDP